MEKSPTSCHLFDPLTMLLTSKLERNPLGDPSTLSLRKNCQYSRNTLRKYSIKERFALASHQQMHLSSSFQNHMAEAYDYG